MPDDRKPPLTREDLKTMTAREIVDAKARGELDHLLAHTPKDNAR